jgi:hypothetical protein
MCKQTVSDPYNCQRIQFCSNKQKIIGFSISNQDYWQFRCCNLNGTGPICTGKDVTVLRSRSRNVMRLRLRPFCSKINYQHTGRRINNNVTNCKHLHVFPNHFYDNLNHKKKSPEPFNLCAFEKAA